MPRNALESDTIFELHLTYNSNNGHICIYFSCPIYSIYKFVGWKLVVKIKLFLFKAFYLILIIEYTICRPLMLHPGWTTASCRGGEGDQLLEASCWRHIAEQVTRAMVVVGAPDLLRWWIVQQVLTFGRGVFFGREKRKKRKKEKEIKNGGSLWGGGSETLIFFSRRAVCLEGRGR